MTNPLIIIPLMMRAVRPSRMNDMKAVSNSFWLRKGYEAVTFFGTIITHNQQEADRMNKRFDALKNHEMIHLRQAQATGDSWIRFYWKYFIFWLKARRFRKQLRNAGYLLNPFEMEAYLHMYDLSYLSDKKSGTNEWRRFASMSLEERLCFYHGNLL